ncbi:hypothetical protein CAPTEDRAFT_195739 [Capitella teleta]|uniref:Uncharacterized protein n=1 Tax=Capitella teleta TaxID=283909 RepID=R7UGD4_CAPTE|nr:hypothetical protein CAPTEDRAFT_195739 [Capitella teleta]|eukprot:ELU05574.1 hypothetical protein CAPTEDRAFT_195739 [Capitella teleta]
MELRWLVSIHDESENNFVHAKSMSESGDGQMVLELGSLSGLRVSHPTRKAQWEIALRCTTTQAYGMTSLLTLETNGFVKLPKVPVALEKAIANHAGGFINKLYFSNPDEETASTQTENGGAANVSEA